MSRPIFSNIHPITALLLISFVTLFGLLGTMIVAFAFGLAFFPLNDLMAAFLGDTSNIVILKYLQVASTTGIFIIPALLAGYLFSKSTFRYLAMNSTINLSAATAAIVVIMTIALLPMVDICGYWNQQMQLPDAWSGLEQWMRNSEEMGKILTEKFTKVHTVGGLVINIIMIGVLPALGEEMLFRGTVQPLFQRWLKNDHVAVWLTAILFSAVHMQFFGFLPRMLLGAFMGYLVMWSGNLWLPILAHFTNNTMGVIMYYMYYNGIIQGDPDSLGYQSNLWPVAISVAILALLAYALQRKIINGPQTRQNEV